MSFLKLPPVSQQLTKKDFKTYTVVSKLLISLCIQDPKCLPRILGQQKVTLILYRAGWGYSLVILVG